MPRKDAEARRAYNRAYFQANRARLIADMRERNKQSSYVAKRVAYAQDHPEVIRRLVKAWRKRNPEKRRAWWAFNNALRAGKIVKPDTCSKCGKKAIIDGHHSDYSKPLEVEWLCRPCHTKQHAQNNQQRDNTHEQ